MTTAGKKFLDDQWNPIFIVSHSCCILSKFKFFSLYLYDYEEIWIQLAKLFRLVLEFIA